jgi:hypothetical protein
MTVSVRLAVLLLAPSLAAAAPSAVPPEPGEEWENTVEMQMAGFSMPAQTSKSCVPKKGMTDPPGTGKDDKCKVTRMKNDGKTMSWSMVCEGKEKMSGEGEITQTAGGYDGKMTMRTADGEMLMKMRGKKLGTPCDSAEIKRTMVAVQAEGEKNMAKACREAAQRMSVMSFAGPQAMCKDPADRALLCERAATREGVRGLGAQPEMVTKDLGAVCGKDFAAMKLQACSAAGREEAGTKCAGQPSSVLGFIGESCPAQTQVIAQRECAGRSYTDLSNCYRSFCTAFAGNLLDKGKKPAAQPQNPQDPAQDAAQDAAKKAVKSLLPF